MKISQQAFIAAWENQKLVRGAIKCAHVRQDYTNYEDFLQEGLLIYAQMLTEQANLPRKEVDRLSFRKVLWHTIDLLRQDKRHDEQQTSLVTRQEISQISHWDNLITLQKEVTKMSALEQQIFVQHLLLQKPVSQLASELKVSRVQLQRVKKSLLQNLRVILER